MKTILFSAAIGLVSLCSAIGDNLPEGGGSSISLRVQERENDDGTRIPITKEQVDQVVLVIEKRLKLVGIAKPLFTRQGGDCIVVQMPGVDPKEVERISATLGKVAKLELRQVSPRTDEPGPDGRVLAQRVKDGDEIVPGYRAYKLKGKDEKGNESARAILLNRRIALSGSDIARAMAAPQQPDAVDITLNGQGTEKMIALTSNMRPGVDRIAILLDGEVISAPVVNQTPLGKRFMISGLEEPGETQSLANSLMNPLENPLKVEEVRSTAPANK